MSSWALILFRPKWRAPLEHRGFDPRRCQTFFCFFSKVSDIRMYMVGYNHNWTSESLQIADFQRDVELSFDMKPEDLLLVITKFFARCRKVALDMKKQSSTQEQLYPFIKSILQVGETRENLVLFLFPDPKFVPLPPAEGILPCL